MTPTSNTPTSNTPTSNKVPNTMRIDLHCHSVASHDCLIPLEDFPERCLEAGIKVQAITDHDQLWGGLELQNIVAQSPYADTFTVIAGEEVMTQEGEIIGLFLQERITPKQTPEATIAAIREQGGLVLLPHGFDPKKRHRLKPAALQRVYQDIDIIEIFNARVSNPKYNEAARAFAQEHHLAMSAGTDAHTLKDIGAAYVETPTRAINTPEDLIAALQAGHVEGQWTHPVEAFAYKMWDQARTLVGNFTSANSP